MNPQMIVEALNAELQIALKEIVKTKITLRILSKEDPETVMAVKEKVVNGETKKVGVTVADFTKQQQANLDAAELRFSTIWDMIQEEEHAKPKS